MKPEPRPIPPHLLAELEAIAADKDRLIDTSDIPEVTDFSGFRRGLLRNPELRGEAVRVDPAVLHWFRAHTPEGEDYAARIDAVLREYVARAGEREAA